MTVVVESQGMGSSCPTQKNWLLGVAVPKRSMLLKRGTPRKFSRLALIEYEVCVNVTIVYIKVSSAYVVRVR